MGKFEAVDTLLKTWIGRHGNTAQVREIRNRQALLRYGTEPAETRAYLKSIFGLTFNHQRQVPGEAPDLPTALDPALISRESLLKRALDNPSYRDSIDGFHPHAYSWLISEDLSPNRLRKLLQALRLPDYPGLPERIAKDLDTRHSGGFGSMEIHKMLVRGQLDALLHLKPALLNDDAFIETYLRRLLPGNDDANWRQNPESMKAYLDRLWTFVEGLAPAQNSLRVHVLYHRLAFDRTHGVYDHDRFLQYVKIPRVVDYVNPAYLKKPDNSRFAADLARNFEGSTALDLVRSDEELVAHYIRHYFATADGYDAYKPYIRERYLRRLFAETKLLQGAGDLEQWYSWLDPVAVDALKNRVDVAFAPENKQRFGLDETVTLDVWVKNVDRLLVKVFEIDTKSYYQALNWEINTAIDLDGLVANQEQVYAYSEAPLRRVRRQFSLPELTGRGVWVVEFVGNGTSSRAVVAKGALQYVSRTGPAGQVFTVFDESGAQVPDASIWFSGRSYTADKDGEITLPFSTNPGTKNFILSDGEFASRRTFEHAGEVYRLSTGFHVDAESLRAGRMAEVAVRPLLYLNGTPMPLNLLKHPVLDIRSRTHDGIESSQQIADIALQNNELTVQPFRVPENLAALTFTLSSTVEPLTGGDPVPLRAEQQIAVNGIHAMPQTAALLLTRIDTGYGLEIRDKTGLGIADRVVNLTVHHRDFADALSLDFKTDGDGRVALGALRDIQMIGASSAGVSSKTWPLARPAFTFPGTLQGSTSSPLRLPWVGAIPKRVADGASLLEMRQDVFLSDRTASLSLEGGYLVISGLPAGDYMLHLKDSGRRITVRVTDGEDKGGYVASERRVLTTRTPTALQIQSVDGDSGGVKIQVGGANSFTRVHVVATRFLPDRYLYSRMYVTTSSAVASRPLGQSYALYTSGRQIGDEYRYILERRFAMKFPGNMLERPSLLLNPWAIKETHASQEAASVGEEPAAMAPPASVSSPAPMRTREMKEEREPLDVSPSFDFLDGDGVALYNLEPNENGVVTITAEDLQGRSYLQIVATDPFATVSRYEALAEQPWTPRDLRLAKALDPASHLVEQKRVKVLAAGDTLKVSLTGDADVQVYDSVPSVLGLLMTLNGDAKLKEFSFVGGWPELSAEEKLEKFSKYASHEFNFFLYHKDRAFFNDTVRPFLANKYQKTFLDHWLLADDLSDYVQPWRLGQLNLVEKILLAKRLTSEQGAIARSAGDALEMIPPNPKRFNQLFMAALHGRALEGGFGSNLQNVEIDGSIRIRGNFYDYDDNLQGGGGAFSGERKMKRAMRNVEADSDLISRNIEQSKQLPEAADSRGIKNYVYKARDKKDKEMDLLFATVNDAQRGQYRALYRATEKTQALVENDYYKLRIEEAHAGLIPVNAFWLDYAKAKPNTPFLSSHLAEAASSFTEAMLALAVLDLPFESPKHEASASQGDYSLTAGGAGIAFYKDIEAAAAPDGETPILVSQNYFREDDRFRHEGNQRFDKFVTEEFLTGVLYGCQITVTNPTSTPHQIEVLRQVPAGALPVNSGRYTKSERMALAPYSTARLEYFFYFPKAGDFAHYPVHVSKNGVLLAFAESHVLPVVEVPSRVDTTTWAYVSQQAPAEEVLEYLKKMNLNRIDLNRILWRMKDKAFYRQVLGLLKERIVYAPELWSYSVHHNDADAMKTYLRYRQDFVLQSGPCIESDLLTIDPVERKTYQHIEYAPLINPRAHHPEGKWMITNTQLMQQYRALMNVLAHRPALRPDDLLALSYYLLLQDRVGDALHYFERVEPGQLSARVQYDYLNAYLAFYREDSAAAAAIAASYQDYPVARWRKLFAQVSAQAAEIADGEAGQSE
ncbi:MAG: hypothetical protein L3K26_04210, partial [Candidatus Hydrogenedentes bacterium]|nr:hypothetical protein [Candidatus Hydrogenedentota bacterium]